MATRSSRRSGSGVATGKPRRGSPKPPPADPRDGVEEIAARAARLGITAERVLQEYAHIAFADLRHIVEWDDGGFRIKPLEEIGDDAAAISEIVPGTDPAHSRVKLYDKKAALDAIARHLGMFPLPPKRREDEAAEEEAEDPREFLARELARLAARTGQD